MNGETNSRKKYNWLPDFVYGAIDGTITTFAVVAGVKGASLSVSIILILGFANLFGDGFSMAIGKYLSDKARLDELKNNGVDHSHEVHPLKGGLYTFLSFVIVGLIPLLGYIIGPIMKYDENTTFGITVTATLLALFTVGAIKGKIVNKSKIYAGFQTMMIGGIAATIAYIVGFFIQSLMSS